MILRDEKATTTITNYYYTPCCKPMSVKRKGSVVKKVINQVITTLERSVCHCIYLEMCTIYGCSLDGCPSNVEYHTPCFSVIES